MLSSNSVLLDPEKKILYRGKAPDILAGLNYFAVYMKNLNMLAHYLGMINSQSIWSSDENVSLDLNFQQILYHHAAHQTYSLAVALSPSLLTVFRMTLLVHSLTNS